MENALETLCADQKKALYVLSKKKKKKIHQDPEVLSMFHMFGRWLMHFPVGMDLFLVTYVGIFANKIQKITSDFSWTR